MSAWFLLGLGVYLLVEWMVATWLATLIGWGGVLLVVLVLVIIGAAVMRRAGANAFRSLRPQRIGDVTVTPAATQDTVDAVGRDVSDASSLFVAGLLIAVPGIVTSVVGLVLLIPPVRRWASRRTALVAAAVVRISACSTLTRPAPPTSTPAAVRGSSSRNARPSRVRRLAFA